MTGSPVALVAGRGRRSTKGRGFSLIELLVVIAIMGLLASIAMPLADLSRQRGKEEDLRRALREIRGALDAYKRLVDEGRIAKPADSSGYPPSLEVLVEGIPDAKSPQGTKLFLLRSLARDPFAPAEIVEATATWSLRSYASPPENPRPGKDVYDVHSKSSALGFNGIAHRKW